MKFGTLTAACAIVLLGAASPAPSASPAPPTTGGTPWNTAEIAALHRAIDTALRDPAVRGAHLGVVALDTGRATPLYAHDANDEFTPASNFKVLTGSAALARLGTSFAYTTTLASDVAPVGDTIAGNVYLRGGGDALLTENDLRDAAAAVAARGVRHITGAVVTDASHFDDQRYGAGWSWDDLPYYYAPVITALELDDGTAHMYFSPGAMPGDQAIVRVDPASTSFAVTNALVTGPAGSSDTSELERPWDEPRTIAVSGSYPLDAKTSGDVSPSVPDPQSYAGDIFARALAAAGITVDGAVRSGVTPANAPVLWTHHSEPMPKLLADFWYPSDNLMGELFLKELGVVEGGEPGSDEHGAALEAAFLRTVGVDPATVDIADGSGLSSYDRITPADLVAILQYDWASPNRTIVLDALPVAGVRGTMRGDFAGTPLQGIVFAKTGSVRHVRTMSGFVQNRRHGAVTFSLMVNDWMGDLQPNGRAQLDRVRAAILTALANL